MTSPIERDRMEVSGQLTNPYKMKFLRNNGSALSFDTILNGKLQAIQCWTLCTVGWHRQKKRPLFQVAFLHLVAGAGFEPTTFGL
jgi:lipoprotein signal peptidase